MFSKIQNDIRGFTLIELMIVIAIVAILVALAVPAYQVYSIRARVIECIGGGAVPKLAISEFYQSMSKWPANATEATIAQPAGQSAYCEGYKHYNSKDGSFDIMVDESAVGMPSTVNDFSLKMIPEDTQGSINWYCFAGHVNPSEYKYLPSTCRCANKDWACAK